MNTLILAIFAMCCITAIELMAVYRGINGKVMALTIGALAALGGASLASFIPQLLGGN